jgi:hypothetical protein
MHYVRSVSLCLSSQSGCPLTCTFCATGSMDFGRNLDVRILDQALLPPPDRGRPCGIHGDGRRCSTSTRYRRGARLPDIGITHRRTTSPRIKLAAGPAAFVDEVTSRSGSLSLHAPDDELRSRIMPVNGAAHRGHRRRVPSPGGREAAPARLRVHDALARERRPARRARSYDSSAATTSIEFDPVQPDRATGSSSRERIAASTSSSGACPRHHPPDEGAGTSSRVRPARRAAGRARSRTASQQARLGIRPRCSSNIAGDQALRGAPRRAAVPAGGAAPPSFSSGSVPASRAILDIASQTRRASPSSRSRSARPSAPRGRSAGK